MSASLPPPYPLAWPDGQARSKEKVKTAFKATLPQAVANVQKSLAALAKDSGIAMGEAQVTCNQALMGGDPTDTGVAVWFMWDGAMRCIAVDRYVGVAANLQAVHHVLEARRTELRHAGIEMTRTTFKGFLALPAPDGRKPWWEVLEVSATATVDQIREARRALARRFGADNPKMVEVNAAYDEAMKGRKNG